MNNPIDEVLFLDIETAPLHHTVDEMQTDLQSIYLETKKTKKKTKKKSKDEESSDEPKEEETEDNFGGTGLQAEFGKVICVSLGRFEGGHLDENLKIHSIYSDDEVEILTNLSKVFAKYPDFKLCAHNGKTFDFPFLGRRYLINKLPLPSCLNIMGKKPWEVPHIDTMELWAFGAKGSTVKLKLLCAVFGIPSPKDDIDGSDVADVYYKENDLKRIATYCEKDVSVLAKVIS